MSAEVENQAWGYKSDDAARADIRQEMLWKVDARVGAQSGQHKERQHHHTDLHPGLAVSLIGFQFMTVCQENRETSTEHEECRGVPWWERVAMMHINALYQRQNHVMVVLEHTDGTVGTDGMFQDLQHTASRQFTNGKENR